MDESPAITGIFRKSAPKIRPMIPATGMTVIGTSIALPSRDNSCISLFKYLFICYLLVQGSAVLSSPQMALLYTCLNRFELMHRKLPPAEIFFLSSLAFPAVFI